MPENIPTFVDCFVNLAQERIGARVVSASDEFFASRHRLIDPGPPVFKDGVYDDHGKWMDGWESRRRRSGGHDWCLIRICPGTIRGFEIDTSFFTGNYPPEASIDACTRFDGDPDPLDDSQWQPLVSRFDLNGDDVAYIATDSNQVWTHLRFNIFPDGGVARLRVYGVAHRDWSEHDASEPLDLIALLNGGRALACNDMHYGHMCKLILPDDSINMGDGWETRRRREPGNDWVILKLGQPGIAQRLEVATQWFKGNYPAACVLSGAMLSDDAEEDITPDLDAWKEILPRSELGPDGHHVFDNLNEVGTISHIKLDIFPDGGISRLRLIGLRDPEHQP